MELDQTTCSNNEDNFVEMMIHSTSQEFEKKLIVINESDDTVMNPNRLSNEGFINPSNLNNNYTNTAVNSNDDIWDSTDVIIDNNSNKSTLNPSSNTPSSSSSTLNAHVPLISMSRLTTLAK